MKTISVKLYSFNELNEQSKQKVLKELECINVNDNWWEFIYEDAERIGLKLTGFDLDRNKHAKGEFILSANEVAENIFQEFTSNDKLHEIATNFMDKWQPLFNDYMDEDSEHYESREQEGKIQDLESDFLDDLLNEYANMLQNEMEYQISDEVIIETIEANEFTFEADGTLRNS